MILILEEEDDPLRPVLHLFVPADGSLGIIE
jgi:hypothetical protein